ncbi:hypothetical protein SCG7109_AD_00420 [Chlamydiales bacterium SCGC AG-110-M15]|nr:hypothetical protein SCG7109_AD_00420 [Chlamydiales bacterium SCGC AG-110-M15]
MESKNKLTSTEGGEKRKAEFSPFILAILLFLMIELN